jgi:hypothetical protein
MAILGQKHYRFGLRDPDLVDEDIYGYLEYFMQFKWVLGFLT